MRLPSFMIEWLRRKLIFGVAASRPPDVVIGDDYMRRWFIILRNRFFNIYLHNFIHSDDDRALHCHPWWNLSCLLDGEYIEHTISAGGVHKKVTYKAGDLKLRRGEAAHRVELLPDARCWSLFITGPRYREWYFHCRQKMVHWRDFTNPTDSSKVGAGCGEYA